MQTVSNIRYQYEDYLWTGYNLQAIYQPSHVFFKWHLNGNE